MYYTTLMASIIFLTAIYLSHSQIWAVLEGFDIVYIVLLLHANEI